MTSIPDDLLEAMARAMIADDSGPEGSTLFGIHMAEFGEGYRKSLVAALTALDAAGWVVVLKEPSEERLNRGRAANEGWRFGAPMDVVYRAMIGKA